MGSGTSYAPEIQLIWERFTFLHKSVCGLHCILPMFYVVGTTAEISLHHELHIQSTIHRTERCFSNYLYAPSLESHELVESTLVARAHHIGYLAELSLEFGCDDTNCNSDLLCRVYHYIRLTQQQNAGMQCS